MNELMNKPKHTCVHIYIYIHIYIRTSHIHTYIHTYMHAYIHTYIDTYIHMHTPCVHRTETINRRARHALCNEAGGQLVARMILTEEGFGGRSVS